MTPAFDALSQNPLAVSIISLLVGALGTLVVTTLRNKSGVLGYTSTWNRVGISTDDDIFGQVRVHWENNQLRNLYFYTIEIENLSTRDFDNVDLRIYSGKETVILNERTAVVDEPEIVHWSPEFRKKMRVEKSGSPTDDQIEEYNHGRQYLIPVLNRRRKLTFSYLCTKPNDDGEPGIYASTQAKGVRLKRLKPPFVVLNPIWGVPIPTAIVRGFIMAAVVVIVCGAFLRSVWVASLLSVVIGLFGQIFGAALHRLERKVVDLFTR